MELPKGKKEERIVLLMSPFSRVTIPLSYDKGMVTLLKGDIKSTILSSFFPLGSSILLSPEVLRVDLSLLKLPLLSWAGISYSVALYERYFIRSNK